MIKQTWNIGEEERKRILNLHETATKKLYILKEQQSKSWGLCGYIIFEDGGKYFVDGGVGGQSIEVPKLSEVAGVIEDRNLVLNDVTQSGRDLGERFNSSQQCANKRPANTYGANGLFVYFDDLESGVPMFGVIGYYGKMQTGVAEFMGEKIQKDKDGVVIQYGKSRSKSFLIEVSPAMRGTPIIEKENPIPPTPPKEETIQLDVQSPFVFDKTILTPEADVQFKKFLENVKKDYQGVKGNVEVITSASIDSSGKEQYDMNLSKRRADAIIELLKSSLSDIPLTFIPKPIGQTDQFDPGKTYKNGFKPDETAANRRLIIKLPKITKEVK